MPKEPTTPGPNRPAYPLPPSEPPYIPPGVVPPGVAPPGPTPQPEEPGRRRLSLQFRLQGGGGKSGYIPGVPPILWWPGGVAPPGSSGWEFGKKVSAGRKKQPLSQGKAKTSSLSQLAELFL